MSPRLLCSYKHHGGRRRRRLAAQLCGGRCTAWRVSQAPRELEVEELQEACTGKRGKRACHWPINDCTRDRTMLSNECALSACPEHVSSEKLDCCVTEFEGRGVQAWQAEAGPPSKGTRTGGGGGRKQQLEGLLPRHGEPSKSAQHSRRCATSEISSSSSASAGSCCERHSCRWSGQTQSQR